MSLKSTKRIGKRTIARDISFGLTIIVSIVVAGLFLFNYLYSESKYTAELQTKLDDLVDNLSEVLVTPMWNLNESSINNILIAYKYSDHVTRISVADGQGVQRYVVRNGNDTPFLTESREVHYKAKKIGAVKVAFSGASILARQKQNFISSVLIFIGIIMTIVFATIFLLEQTLSLPFSRMIRGLEIISSGDYSHVLEPVKQSDINAVTQKVNLMALEISKREQSLQENHKQLEILNQAIVELFSASDVTNLIRTLMQLCHRVVGAEQSWFLASENSIGEGDNRLEGLTSSYVCMMGKTFEAVTGEVKSQIGKDDGSKFFTFDLKVGESSIGILSLAFVNQLEQSGVFILKSMISLAGEAISRQVFIRESAFMTAELTVAESVQKSMLPDLEATNSLAEIQYHYEPYHRVGGDWFSVIESKDSQTTFVIMGDVTGHGLAQGLVTTAVAGAINMVETMMKEFGSKSIEKPSEIISLMSNVLRMIAGKSNLMMTCVAAKIDFHNMEVTVCNAGHTFPLILRRDGTGSTVLPLVKNQQSILGNPEKNEVSTEYGDSVYSMEENDVIVIYTDGLTEASDESGKAYKRTFIRNISRETAKKDVKGVRDHIVAGYQAFTKDSPVEDDVCILVIGKKTGIGNDSAGAA